MDIIYINELKIDALIGIYGWERQIPQTIVLDIEMGADIAKAATSDQIEDTLSYKDVAKRLIEFVGNSEFLLVETLTEQISAIILQEFSVPWVRIRLNKRGAVRGSRDVGICIERSR
ncbi:MAG: dihydroneopterin aldolase [Pseudomonadota bacterium]